MKMLDREINGFLNFDQNDIAAQMNNAFEGKKETWKDKMAKNSMKADHSILKSKSKRSDSKKNVKSKRVGCFSCIF